MLNRFLGRGATSRAVVACGLLALGASAAQAAPKMGFGVEAGTTGIGLDLDVGFSRWVSASVGYSTFSLSRTINQTNVTYSGKLKINDASALFNWYVFGGGFHLTAGGVGGGGLKVDAVGRPSNGFYQLGNDTYSAAEVGSVSGQLKFGNSFAPYVGLGWGNPVGFRHHLHFLFNAGAIYGGTPNVTLIGTCGSAIAGTPVCTQLQSDVAAERQKLEQKVTLLKWYPVLNLGMAYRF